MTFSISLSNPNLNMFKYEQQKILKFNHYYYFCIWSVDYSEIWLYSGSLVDYDIYTYVSYMYKLVHNILTLYVSCTFFEEWRVLWPPAGCQLAGQAHQAENQPWWVLIFLLVLYMMECFEKGNIVLEIIFFNHIIHIIYMWWYFAPLP